MLFVNFGCKTYDGVGTLIPVEGNIDVPKYMKILNANLKPFVPGKTCYSQNDSAPSYSSRFTQEWKTTIYYTLVFIKTLTKEIPDMTWPLQCSDINVIENLRAYN